MKAEIKDGNLIVTIPINDPPIQSGGGRNRQYIARSNPELVSGVKFNGKSVFIRLNAFIVPTGIELSEVEWAYIAGLIDGEGTISLTRTTSGYLQKYVEMTNSCYDVVEWFAAICGNGSTRTGRAVPNHKTVYRHLAVGETAIRVCSRTLPYLRIKKRQAELLLELAEIQNDHSAPGNRLAYKKGKTYRDDVSQERILKEIRELNRRGISA